jgi:hypothetical protein
MAARCRAHAWAASSLGAPADWGPALRGPLDAIAGYAELMEMGIHGPVISRDLPRGMGGDLSAEHTFGVGSTFTLTLVSACRTPLRADGRRTNRHAPSRARRLR